jgi:hypothetical protein
MHVAKPQSKRSGAPWAATALSVAGPYMPLGMAPRALLVAPVRSP